MTSPQDSLNHQNGIYGGVHISSAAGNLDTPYTGAFGRLEVHTAATLRPSTISNIENITGIALPAGTYLGIHDVIEVSGGALTAYRYPRNENPIIP